MSYSAFGHDQVHLYYCIFMISWKIFLKHLETSQRTFEENRTQNSSSVDMCTVILRQNDPQLSKREVYLSDAHWSVCTLFSISNFSWNTDKAMKQSPFDRFCHEDREQLFLQAEHAKGELCVTIANWGWEDIFLQWLDVTANKKDNFFPFIFIGWRLITLQYCSGFCHSLTWINHGITCIPSPDPPSYPPLQTRNK